jgi:hypothetical protein
MTSRSGHRLTCLVVAAVLAAGCGSQSGAPGAGPGSPGPTTAGRSPSASGASAVPPSDPPVQPSPSSSPVPQSSPARSEAPARSTAPSAPPTTAPSPSAAQSSSPAAPGAVDARTYRSPAEIRDVLFAPDGRIVLVESDWAGNRSAIVTLDEHGSVLSGWPWSAGDTGNPIADAALGPDRSVWVAVRGQTTGPLAWSWNLHRLDSGAHELPGFPVPLPDVPFCDLAVAAAGIAYAWCESDGDPGPVSTVVRAFRPDGTTVAGWPVSLDGSASIAGFRPDDGIVIETRSGRGSTVTVLRPDATVVEGWPRPVPSDATVAVDTDGRLHVTARTWSEGQCGPADRTSYTVLRRNGTTVPGWPISRRGWASDPLVADDGSMTIVTDTGRAVRYAPGGEIMDGWPVMGVAVSVGCYAGSLPVSAGGAGVVVAGEGKVTLLAAGGRVARGWPVDPPYRLAFACETCVPGPSAPLPPAVGRRGVWVGTYRGERPRIVGITRDGRLPKTWQRAVGQRGDQLVRVDVAPTGRVWALLGRWSNGAQAETSLLVPVGEDRSLAE